MRLIYLEASVKSKKSKYLHWLTRLFSNWVLQINFCVRSVLLFWHESTISNTRELKGKTLSYASIAVISNLSRKWKRQAQTSFQCCWVTVEWNGADIRSSHSCGCFILFFSCCPAVYQIHHCTISLNAGLWHAWELANLLPLLISLQTHLGGLASAERKLDAHQQVHSQLNKTQCYGDE